MTTLRKWFDEFTRQTGETPTAIVTKPMDEDGWPDRYNTTDQPVRRWAEVDSDVLDREFDDGYGGPESPDLCAWSDTYVIFSYVYDGAEGLVWVPRNPTPHAPIRPGGW